MKKTAIFFGSTGGNCERIATEIARALGVDASSVFNVSQLDGDKIAMYDNLILGSSTWGCGDLQDDWYEGVDLLKTSDLSGKTAAVFGCGDSCGFSSTFCDAMATIYDAAKGAGARMIGAVSTDGYSFDESASVIDGMFVGLPLDEDNESSLTEGRIASWAACLMPEL